MESLEHNCGNISPTICTNMLIFGNDTFLMISTNAISSQILVFVTSHFTTLLCMQHVTTPFSFQGLPGHPQRKSFCILHFKVNYKGNYTLSIEIYKYL